MLYKYENNLFFFPIKIKSDYHSVFKYTTHRYVKSETN